MTLRLLAAWFGICIVCCASSIAEDRTNQKDKRANKQAVASPDESSDLGAIRAASHSFVAAFNRGDAKAVAEHWTEGGEFVDESGRTFTGRAAIAAEYAAFFKAAPKAKIRIAIDSLKLLSNSAALEEGRAILDPAPPGASAVSKYLVVHVKSGDKWLMSTVRDSKVELPSTFQQVADLDWLIGTWTAEEHGVTTESDCRWIANKSFVQRSHTTTGPDGVSTSGLQLIGWNPEIGHIQSWDFSAGGGHAVGVWTRLDDGWQAQVRGVTSDGVVTTAMNTLRKLDDNAYVWQSTQRTVAGEPIADTDEIVIKRQPMK